MAKKSTDGAKSPSKTPSKSAPAVAVDAELAPAAAEIAKTTKARGSSVPPKAGRAGSSAAAASTSAAKVTQTVAAVDGAVASRVEVSDDHVREHAYHLWLNGHPGSHHDHWYEAERTLRSKK